VQQKLEELLNALDVPESVKQQCSSLSLKKRAAIMFETTKNTQI
jgi:hypothetical protein